VPHLLVEPSVERLLKEGGEKTVHIKCKDPAFLESAGIQVLYKSKYSDICTCKVSQAQLESLKFAVAALSNAEDVEVFEDATVHIL